MLSDDMIAKLIVGAITGAVLAVVLGRNKLKLPPIGKAGFTKLMHTAAIGYDDGCKKLLDEGAYISQQDDEGNTALTYAVLNHQEKVVRLLLSKGADKNMASKKDGLTPLALANQILSSKKMKIAPLSLEKNNPYEAIVKLLESE